MDYEKMYKAALKTATQWIEDGCSDKEKICLESIFPELRESEDERIRKALIKLMTVAGESYILSATGFEKERFFAYLERKKEASKAIEAVERIDKYIDEHLANAHDMKDSNPGKKYYRGWDDALGEMAGILQDVYSGERQKEPEDVSASTMIPSCWTEKQKENANSFTEGVIEVRSFQRGVEEGRRLEKQKEHQNNSDAPKKALGRALTSPLDKDMNLDEIAQDYVDGVKEYNPEPTWDLMQTAVCYGYHLAEQKPAEYLSKDKVYAIMNKLTELSTSELIPLNSDEYKKINEITSDVRSLLDYPIEQKPNIELIQKSWYMEGYHDKEFNCEPKWIIKTGEGGPRYEENPKYGQIIEQKPAEWSEEDDLNCNRIIRFLEPHKTFFPMKETKEEMQNWIKNRFKFLRPVKQELSEEDERKLQRCIEIVECWEGDYDIAYTPYSNFLKSLRPSWKPSEAQLMALHSVIDDESDTIGNEQLKLLYNDLKKL